MELQNLEFLRARQYFEINPDGSDLRSFAAGLRNPVGMVR